MPPMRGEDCYKEVVCNRGKLNPLVITLSRVKAKVAREAKWEPPTPAVTSPPPSVLRSFSPALLLPASTPQSTSGADTRFVCSVPAA